MQIPVFFSFSIDEGDAIEEDAPRSCVDVDGSTSKPSKSEHNSSTSAPIRYMSEYRKSISIIAECNLSEKSK